MRRYDSQALSALSGIAGLIRDRGLEELRCAEARCAQTRGLIAGLEVAPATDLTPVARAHAEAAYQNWADARRRELTAMLARQLVERERSLASARQAFGRSEALRQVIERQNDEIRKSRRS